MNRLSKTALGLVLGLAAFYTACKSNANPADSPKIPRSGLTFPCHQGSIQKPDAGDGGDGQVIDSGIPLNNFDPNNCGQCGTICGTYINKGAGYSFSQGTCLNNTLGCYKMNQPSPAVLATTTTDCYDNYGGGWVVNTQDGALGWEDGGHGLCANIMSDPNNCGTLGYSCIKLGTQGCVYGHCQ